MEMRRGFGRTCLTAVWLILALCAATAQAQLTNSTGQLLSDTRNPLVNNPAFDTTNAFTQSETTLVLGSGSTIVVAYNDTASTLVGAHVTGFSISTDGGLCFEDRGALPFSLNGDLGDPVLARDNVTGTIYLSTLFFTGTGMQIFRSFDNGFTFTSPVNGAPGFAGGDFLDKEWMAVDNFAGPGQGTIYLAFRNFAGGGGGSRPNGIYLTKSIDGGTTWTPSKGTQITTGASTQGAFVTVGTDHAVYVFWFATVDEVNVIRMKKSTNGGVTFGSTVEVATLASTTPAGDLELNGGFRSNSFPQAVVNPITGDIYVVFNDVGIAEDDSADAYFTQSTDGGTSWSAPQQLNDDPTTTDQFFPAIAVTPDGSRVFVGWYDRRGDDGNSLIDRFGVIGSVAGPVVTFGQNFKYGTRAFPVDIGREVPGSTYMGDYDQAVADNSFFYSTWGDNRNGQPDVRFAKIPVTGPVGAQLTLHKTIVKGGNGNARIDLNECNNLVVKVRNNGLTAATGISAFLSTTTPGVIVTQPKSTYPSIPAGKQRRNDTLFQINTSPAYSCGPISFTLTIRTATDGSFAIPFELQAGESFDNDIPVPVPDLETANSLITVTNFPGAVPKVTVSLFLSHLAVFNTRTQLVAPDGTIVTLVDQPSGFGVGLGQACSPRTARITFDDDASTSIVNAPSLVGTFRPAQPLSTLIGKPGNGTWQLRVVDLGVGIPGSIQCWSLFLTPCPNGGGQCTAFPQVVGPDLTGYFTALYRVVPTTDVRAVFASRNNGNQDSGPYTVKLFLADQPIFRGEACDTLLTTSTISNLGSQRSSFIDLRFNMPPGVSAQGKYGIGVVDSADKVGELSEQNNVIVFGPIP